MEPTKNLSDFLQLYSTGKLIFDDFIPIHARVKTHRRLILKDMIIYAMLKTLRKSVWDYCDINRHD